MAAYIQLILINYKLTVAQ